MGDWRHGEIPEHLTITDICVLRVFGYYYCAAAAAQMMVTQARCEGLHWTISFLTLQKRFVCVVQTFGVRCPHSFRQSHTHTHTPCGNPNAPSLCPEHMGRYTTRPDGAFLAGGVTVNETGHYSAQAPINLFQGLGTIDRMKQQLAKCGQTRSLRDQKCKWIKSQCLFIQCKTMRRIDLLNHVLVVIIPDYCLCRATHSSCSRDGSSVSSSVALFPFSSLSVSLFLSISLILFLPQHRQFKGTHM